MSTEINMSDPKELQTSIDDQQQLKLKRNKNAVTKRILSKKISIKAASKRYKISQSCLQQWVNDAENKQNEQRKMIVFSKDDSKKLRDHIKKCCNTPMGITSTQIRKLVYKYALNLPNCVYPPCWDEKGMASVVWLRYFMAEHPELKKILQKKHRNKCICIMGCHMSRPEGKVAFEELEVKFIIARVYHYLEKEYQYLQTYNDLSLLMNILRRTAEATGVCEQTISSILEEEKKSMELIHDDILPKQCENEVTIDLEDQAKHIATNGVESCSSTLDTWKDPNTTVLNNIQPTDLNCSSTLDTLKDPNRTVLNNIQPTGLNSRLDALINYNTMIINNINTSDVNSTTDSSGSIKESSKDTLINIHSSDIERLQQDCPLIKSVKVEILEDDSDDPGEEFIGGDNSNQVDLATSNSSLLKPRSEWSDDEDECALVIATEPSKPETTCEGPEDTEDVVMVMETDPLDTQNKCDDAEVEKREDRKDAAMEEPTPLHTQKNCDDAEEIEKGEDAVMEESEPLQSQKESDICKENNKDIALVSEAEALQLPQNSEDDGSADPNVAAPKQTLVLCIESPGNKSKLNKDDEPLRKRHRLPAHVNEIIRSFRNKGTQPSIQYNLVEKPPSK